jgi:hypothetical protein
MNVLHDQEEEDSKVSYWIIFLYYFEKISPYRVPVVSVRFLTCS